MLPRSPFRLLHAPKSGDTPLEELRVAETYLQDLQEAPQAAIDILLQLSPGADPAQLTEALDAVGGILAEVVRAADADAGPLLRVEVPAGQSLGDAVDILAKQPGVVFAEPNQILEITSTE